MTLKPWKIWLTTAAAFVILVVCALGFALYRNLDTEWSYQSGAAQQALNDSPIARITYHSTFTDIVSEEVFAGHDIFGRTWYAFVSGPPWSTTAIQANKIVSKKKVEQAAMKESVKPLEVHLGYLNDTEQLSYSAPHNVVWEVYGKMSNGHSEYLYFDGETGKQLWKYML